MRQIVTPDVAVHAERLVESKSATSDPLEQVGKHPTVVIPAGVQKNREFNGAAAVRYASRVRELLGADAGISVVARVDDEEVWPESVQALRGLSFDERVANVQQATRTEIMDSDPLLATLERDLEDLDIAMQLLGQPQSTSYMEAYFAVRPGNKDLALPEQTTDLILPASCDSLRERLQLAVQDAIADGTELPQLESVSIMQHANINEGHEAKSLKVAKLLRRALGRRIYRQICVGEGMAGGLYKRLQAWKLRRTQKLSQVE